MNLMKIFWFCQCIFTTSILYPLGKGLGLSFEQTWIPLTQGCFVPSFTWNWSSGSGEEDFLICPYFINISFWKRAGPFIWKKKFNPIHLRMLCAKFGWNWPWQWFWRRRFFISSMYFCYFVIISPWKRAGPIITTNLSTLHPRILCA